MKEEESNEVEYKLKVGGPMERNTSSRQGNQMGVEQQLKVGRSKEMEYKLRVNGYMRLK